MRSTIAATLALVAGCGSGGKDDTATPSPTSSDVTTGGTTTADPDPTGSPQPTGVQTVQLQTRDGVALVGDLYPGDPDAPGIVLLHMTPNGPWSRADWPAAFIEALGGHGWWVIAIDRRGAGDSEGDPSDAHMGETGRYDVEAAVGALTDGGAGSIALIGASNGTTSMIDYAVWAPGEGLPEPVALGFMTGGTYTENQTSMGALPAVPAVFTYSTAERDWSIDQQAGAPSSWTFLEYPNGDHGTRMFDAAPEVSDDLEDFLVSVL